MCSARELLPAANLGLIDKTADAAALPDRLFRNEAAGMRSDGLSPCRSSPIRRRNHRAPTASDLTDEPPFHSGNRWSQRRAVASRKCYTPEGAWQSRSSRRRKVRAVLPKCAVSPEPPEADPRIVCGGLPPFGRWRQSRVNPRRPARYKIVKKDTASCSPMRTSAEVSRPILATLNASLRTYPGKL